MEVKSAWLKVSHWKYSCIYILKILFDLILKWIKWWEFISLQLGQIEFMGQIVVYD